MKYAFLVLGIIFVVMSYFTADTTDPAQAGTTQMCAGLAGMCLTLAAVIAYDDKQSRE